MSPTLIMSLFEDCCFKQSHEAKIKQLLSTVGYLNLVQLSLNIITVYV